ncbi:probable serine/threonine-protein kinase WNK10 [Ricinus communis]|uniref:non-specific serine/threonine protein kinase n=1 Tax=Ricinus communis TaxID=3988 RepID=B9T3L9_RICCO|nr:probable serine/threonine-protein kinase WNK10 [Ricinus communis]EEF29545.1 kinase, putative [Ricinus communis]|eukprot:XP_002532838.1 probable serine/threonine-protein kinase WNK10 [Ricinus communis]
MDLGLREDDDEYVEKDPTGRYLRYNEILGRGAFKTVYKAFDEVNGTEVAWNQVNIEDALNSPDQLVRLYSSEVSLLKSLKHENIMKFFYSWIDDTKKNINIITELFTSGSLSNYRKKHKNVDIKAIKNWARQILRGLHYLHSQNPPIIHRDLKCDNVFVNGNNGEVKIGDLGLALVMNPNQPTAPTVMIGTPEFMAPELYLDEEYNELVDIYSFGMCVLEMVTCGYPYSECKNKAQVYKKVISGIKPASLGKVHDPQVQKFIEKCLVPSSKRLSAIELLNDPFLATGNSKELEISASLQLPSLLQSASYIINTGTNLKNLMAGSSIKGVRKDLEISALEIERLVKKFEFRLRGEKIDDNAVSFFLRIVDQLSGRLNKIEFPFYLDSDTSLSIAEEMNEQFYLSNKDVGVIAEMIDALIMKLAPGWSKSFGISSTSNAPNGSSSGMKISSLEFQRSIEKFEFRLSGEQTYDNTVSCFLHIIEVQSSKSRKVEFSFYFDSDTSLSIAEGMTEELDLFRELEFSSKDVATMIAEMIDALTMTLVPSRRQVGSSSTSSIQIDAMFKAISKQCFLPLPDMKGQETRDSFSSDSTITSATNSNKPLGSFDFSSFEYTSGSVSTLMMHDDDKYPESSGTSLPLANGDEQDELKMELNSIDMYYSQCFQELLRMKEEAIRNAKENWITTTKLPAT